VVKTEPPWIETHLSGRDFTVPGYVTIADLHGDIVDPQLVVFFGGNQFMVTHELLGGFAKKHPYCERVYWETLPPGVLVDQVRQGALVVGNLRIALPADVFTAGRGRIERLQKQAWFDRTVAYASNTLALMVHEGNPKGITSLADMGRDDIRVSMPNPKWEGIGSLVEKSLRKVGGGELVEKITVEKVKTGTTILTEIHHRQTPVRILKGEADAGVVWRTEALFQQRIGNPLELIEIPAEQNQTATLVAARMKHAPHTRAATDFLDYLGEQGPPLYQSYGFLPPEPV
jgi:molybdate transport system substrate-binding protein